jgi:hypothetical protein
MSKWESIRKSLSKILFTFFHLLLFSFDLVFRFTIQYSGRFHSYVVSYKRQSCSHQEAFPLWQNQRWNQYSNCNVLACIFSRISALTKSFLWPLWFPGQLWSWRDPRVIWGCVSFPLYWSLLFSNYFLYSFSHLIFLSFHLLFAIANCSSCLWPKSLILLALLAASY